MIGTPPPTKPGRIGRGAGRALVAAAGLVLLLPFGAALAAETGAAPAPAEAPAVDPNRPVTQTTVRQVGPDGTTQSVAKDATEVERYCLNIADKAQDARYAMQSQQLKDLQKQIDARIAELEAKRQDYNKWLAERQAFLDSASSIVIDIYAKMKPDAAAGQLAALDRDAAASVLAKLKPRAASDILSQMPTKVAAEIAAMIVEKTTGAKAMSANAESGKQS